MFGSSNNSGLKVEIYIVQNFSSSTKTCSVENFSLGKKRNQICQFLGGFQRSQGKEVAKKRNGLCEKFLRGYSLEVIDKQHQKRILTLDWFLSQTSSRIRWRLSQCCALKVLWGRQYQRDVYKNSFAHRKRSMRAEIRVRNDRTDTNFGCEPYARRTCHLRTHKTRLLSFPFRNDLAGFWQNFVQIESPFCNKNPQQIRCETKLRSGLKPWTTLDRRFSVAWRVLLCLIPSNRLFANKLYVLFQMPDARYRMTFVEIQEARGRFELRISVWNLLSHSETIFFPWFVANSTRGAMLQSCIILSHQQKKKNCFTDLHPKSLVSE